MTLKKLREAKGLSRKDSEKMLESLEANLRKRLEELKDEKLH